MRDVRTEIPFSQRMSYRDRFTAAEHVREYEAREYASDSVSSVLWRVERVLLRSIMEDWVKDCANARYLDFACGTGRILAYLETRMQHSVGIDVSEEMLREASRKTSTAVLMCKNLASDSDVAESSYDVITAFRFLSNAEDALRAKVLTGLVRRMHAGSILIANTHTNPFSYKLATWPFYQIARLLGRRIHARYLSLKRLCDLMSRAGLVPVATYGYGFIPGRLLSLFGVDRASRMEIFLANSRFVKAFGVNQIVVCKKG